MDNKYLKKVFDTIVSETNINKEKNNIRFPWFNMKLNHLGVMLESHLSYRLREPHPIYYPFSNHCEDVYGLTDYEIDQVWDNYKEMLKDIVKVNKLIE